MSATVTIGGLRTAFMSVAYRASVDEAVRTASVALGLVFKDLPVRVAPGAAVVVEVAGVPMVTGYIDEVDDDGGPTSRTLTLSLRGRGQDLVDCSAPLGARLQQTVAEVGAALGERYGVTVRADVDPGPRFARVVPTPGETNFDVLDRLARERGLLLMGTGDGGMALTRAGAGATMPTFTLTRPGHILRARWRFALQERFSLYECRSQRAGDANTWGVDLSVTGQAVDEIVPRFRNLLLTDCKGGPEAARQRATWEAATRAGRSATGTLVVAGLVRPDGRPWEPNQLVAVDDQVSGVRGVLLVVSVDGTVSADDAESVSLEVAPVDGYELLVPKVSRGRRGTQLGAWQFTGGTPTLEDVR